MGEQENPDACILPNMPALPSDPDTLGNSIRHYLEYHLGRFLGCNRFYVYESLAYTVRDRLMSDWRNTWCLKKQNQSRRAHYLSLEYLIGRSLGNHLLNLDAREPVEQALKEFAVTLEELEETEPDAGLGNGGLGRLAACFLDSCASLALPVTGLFQPRQQAQRQVVDDLESNIFKYIQCTGAACPGGTSDENNSPCNRFWLRHPGSALPDFSICMSAAGKSHCWLLRRQIIALPSISMWRRRGSRSFSH